MTADLWWVSLCWWCGMLVTLVSTPLICSWAIRHNLLERAGQFHTTHTIQVPRLGGLGLAASFIVVVGITSWVCLRDHLGIPAELPLLVVTCLAMFAVGFVDDLRPLGARVKLAAQILIASGVYAGGLRIGNWANPYTETFYALGVLDYPLTVLWLVGVTNLVNLIDGVDGLAAGITLLLMVLLSLVSGLAGNSFSLLLCIGMVGALLGFLFFNFPPAKIFMGDGGAYFLGMLVAEIGLLNSHKGEVAAALIVPFFALGLPIIDASFTVFRRGLVGLPLFRADRRHIHHRLVGMGFSRQRVVLMLYAVSVFFALLALGGLVSKGRLLPVLFGIFMVVTIASAKMFGFVRDWYKLAHVLSTSVLRRRHIRYALALSHVLTIEAERSGTLDELWKNFGTLLQKLNFREAVLHSQNDEHRWKAEKGISGTGERVVVQEIKGSGRARITFYCDAEQWDEDTFRLLGELAAEAWTKAAAAWRLLNGRV